MNVRKKQWGIMCLLIICLFFNSCKGAQSLASFESEGSSINSETPTNSGSQLSVDLTKTLLYNLLSAEPVKYDVADKKLGYQTNTVSYPQFSDLGKSDTTDIVNDAIEKTVLLNVMDNAEIYSYEYKITLSNRSILSISFLCLQHAEGAPYPSKINFTLNFDLSNGQQVGFSNYANTSSRFWEKALTDEYLLSEFDTAGRATVLKYFEQKETMLKEIELDVQGTYNSSFFGENNTVFLSISVPHALGDFAVFEVPIADIAEYLYYE